MATRASTHQFDFGSKTSLSLSAWVKVGVLTSLAAIVAVLITQAIALSIWPQAAAFKPLDSYLRSALFTLVPALLATGLFAWLSRKSLRPRQTFLKISAIVLAVSLVPDYVLPVPNRTILASSIAAFMHVVAGIVTVGMLFALQENCRKKHS